MVELSNNTIIRILVIHLIAMKNLFALLLCLGMTCSLLAQAPNMDYDPDWDGDGSLGVSDLLGFLALFGDFDTDGDGIWDSVDQCVDMEACNFDSNPSVPCTYLDAIGICGGWCESDENEDGICDFTCGVDSIAYHGYSYATVQIGEQCWFSENSRNLHYANGDEIPTVWNTDEWTSSTEGAQVFYNADSAYLNMYGRLYNWYAVDDARGLCPSGWHVPTDDDFIVLEVSIGMSEIEAGFTGYRSTDGEGDKLKSSMLDSPSWDGTNEFGFSILPAGIREGSFSYVGGHTHQWCSEPDSPYQRTRSFDSSNAGVGRGWMYKYKGLSVRCLKD